MLSWLVLLLTEQYNLIKHVSISNHDAGNTLDLVLTRDDLSVSSIFTDNSVKSDHSAVLFIISCASPGVVKKFITFRKWKSIDVSSVQADIADAFGDFAYQNIDTDVRTYNTTKADIIDNHAPQKSRIVAVRADKVWYTAELSQQKRLRRKYERKYKQSELTVDKLQLHEQRNKYNAFLNSTKNDYTQNKIENAESSKDLYKIYDKLLNREQKSYTIITWLCSIDS